VRARIAIVIMSFDRPHYLEQVLQNVVTQVPFRNARPDFFLFQDGSASERTGAVCGDPEKLSLAQELFARYIPQGTIFASPYNLGVALNFDRAETTIFEKLHYESAIFLEDDLLLQTSYFRIMEQLLEIAAERNDIGMVSARGYRNATPLAEQRRRSGEIRLMDEHNWAFGIHREAWSARNQVLRPYLELMTSIDYRKRDKGEMKAKLAALQKSLSRHGRGYLTSQDSMKNLAFELLGRHRITTFTNNARYIGKVGLHCNEEKFTARGHHETIVYSGEHDEFTVPPREALRRMRLGLQYR
jgi:hypothetical protein